MILESKHIDVKLLDIAADASLKDKMRQGAGDSKALPPQIFNGDEYLGVFLY